jgi:hypothetical protein
MPLSNASSVQISQSPQQTANNFSELLTTATVGPVPSSEISSETTTNRINAVVWNVMPAMTEDLKNSIINFINSDPSGNVIAATNTSPRRKTIQFEFQGSPSNVYKFGEIGIFSIFLGYPSLIIGATTVFGSTQTINIGNQLNNLINNNSVQPNQFGSQ